MSNPTSKQIEEIMNKFNIWEDKADRQLYECYDKIIELTWQKAQDEIISQQTKPTRLVETASALQGRTIDGMKKDKTADTQSQHSSTDESEKVAVEAKGTLSPADSLRGKKGAKA